MPKMNLPNRLTMIRLICSPLIMVVILLPLPDVASRIISVVFFALVSLTDMLDGKIARSRGLITDFGKFIDPLADKFMVTATLLALMAKYDYMTLALAIAVAVMTFRDLAVTSMRLVAKNAEGVVVAARWSGKVKTVAQVIAICVIFIEPLLLPFDFIKTYHPLSYVCTAVFAALTLWSSIDYLKPYMHLVTKDM